MDMEPPEDENVAEFENVLLMKESSSKDCQKKAMNDGDVQKKQASFAMTGRSIEPGSNETLTSKESKRIKMEPHSDSIIIKSEIYEDHDVPLHGYCDMSATKCDDKMVEPSTSLGCSMTNANITNLQEKNVVQSMCSHQKTGHNLMSEHLSNILAVGGPEHGGMQNNHILCHNSAAKDLDCKFCSFKAKSISEIKAHILIHVGEKRFACELCSYKANQMAHLKRHVLIHTGEKPFACEICSYKAKQKSSLQCHISTHTGKKLFACEFCSYQTNRKSHLKFHILIHTGEKPFTCELCSYKTNQKSYLKCHISTHTGEKPFTCEICAFKTNQRSHLKSHIFIHMGEKPFACELCSYKTNRRRNLDSHILVHTQEKSFACQFCSYKANRKGSLKTHLLKHEIE